jgi:hypothetical protein
LWSESGSEYVPDSEESDADDIETENDDFLETPEDIAGNFWGEIYNRKITENFSIQDIIIQTV